MKSKKVDDIIKNVGFFFIGFYPSFKMFALRRIKIYSVSSSITKNY